MSAASTSALPYVPLESFPTEAPATGGNSVEDNMNVYYQVRAQLAPSICACQYANQYDSRVTSPGS